MPHKLQLSFTRTHFNSNPLPCRQTLSFAPRPTSCLKASPGPCRLWGNCRVPCPPPSPCKTLPFINKRMTLWEPRPTSPATSLGGF